jgi:hypothetical protein
MATWKVCLTDILSEYLLRFSKRCPDLYDRYSWRGRTPHDQGRSQAGREPDAQVRLREIPSLSPKTGHDRELWRGVALSGTEDRGAITDCRASGNAISFMSSVLMSSTPVENLKFQFPVNRALNCSARITG